MKKELNIPNSVGFCKNCFRDRRHGSAYCGKCQGEPERMKVYITDEPFPLRKRVEEKFSLKGREDGVVFTYGDTIYAQLDLSYGLVAHELTHVFQQTKMGKELWWSNYLTDDEFRLSQEVQAYRQQYKVYLENDPNNAEYFLDKMATDLSSAMYGELVEFEEAKKIIKGENEKGQMGKTK